MLFEVNVFIHGLDKRKELKLVFGRHEAKQNKATTRARVETGKSRRNETPTF